MHAMRLLVLHFLFASWKPLRKPYAGKGPVEKREAFLREKTLSLQTRQNPKDLYHFLVQRAIISLFVFNVYQGDETGDARVHFRNFRRYHSGTSVFWLFQLNESR